MGLLQNGRWVDQWYNTKGSEGQFVRTSSQFRNWITSDGSAGPSGEISFGAERDRYHLYVSLACPWAHRTLIFRELKGLQSIISISVVHWHMAGNGWTFEPGESVVKDTAKWWCWKIFTNYTLPPKLIIQAGQRSQFCGTKKPKQSFRMSHQKSLGCLNSAFDGIGANALAIIIQSNLRG